MTYPQELREHTRLGSAQYPFNMFRNRISKARQGSVVLGLHWHEHFEIIVMMSGCAVFHIDSKPYEAGPGDILIVPAGGLHVGYSSGEENVEYVAIVFNAALLRSTSPSDPAHEQYIVPYLEGRVHFPAKLLRSDVRHELYHSILLQAIREFEARERAYELIVRAHLHLLFTQLARQYMPERLVGGKSSSAYSRSTERFKQLLEYLEEHYAESVTVRQAAKLVNLNPYHFCKIFKKATGCTLIEYVNLLRMNEAERLLKESDFNVTEIAGRVGCGNANYFTKQFKRYKGRSPSQWRALNL